ncbi:hypothetical protein [Aromatoleum buckelii]|uniref:Protein NO VEIN C-terminal domain-containing protein n=1 Tax=Aromatoleum buckelii TaxID=200254 RepID=A0ABX1N7S4_9RHOO|nr:hypothetical protein [Aromatoleum buckelii]MCK0509562.1 hypothetical protein [Aromatoleum buckelii]
MSVDWAERQRHTNRLVRALANYLFSQKAVTARQIYGLSKLAWITNSYEGESAAYIASTKIPALGDVIGADFSNSSLKQVAEVISRQYGDASLVDLVVGHSGFTNFYKAYRNSVLLWIEANIVKLVPLYRAAHAANSEEERLKIVKSMAGLPGIPKANHPEQLMKPEYFLTPAFFMLDPEIRFPLINGNEGVQNLLNTLEVADSGLVTQYRAMVALYGQGGIVDAADLDQVGRDLPDFLNTNKRNATKKLLEHKGTESDGELPLKDEADVEAIKKAGTITQRRVHNQLTNKLRVLLTKFTLLEGRSESCMFDVLVKNYDSDNNDLLIEVKSSVESAHVRMAIGQLFDYWYKLKGDEEPYLAVLLPERPTKEMSIFLEWLGVGLMWFQNERLCTTNKWLNPIACLS